MGQHRRSRLRRPAAGAAGPGHRGRRPRRARLLRTGDPVRRRARRRSAAPGRPSPTSSPPSSGCVPLGREASWELGAESARALLAAGRAEDALTALQAAAGFQADDPVAKDHRDGVRRALVLAQLDRLAEAVDALPDLDVVGEHPRVFVEWAQAVYKLSGSAQITNTWQLGRVLRQWIDYFGMMGGYRSRVELALVAGDLAVARQGVWQARALADLAESAAAELRADSRRGRARRRAARRRRRHRRARGARPAGGARRLLRRRRRLQRRPRALDRLARPAVRRGPRGHPPPHHHPRLPRLPRVRRRHLLEDARRLRRHRHRRARRHRLPHHAPHRGPPGRAPRAAGRHAAARRQAPRAGPPPHRPRALARGPRQRRARRRHAAPGSTPAASSPPPPSSSATTSRAPRRCWRCSASSPTRTSGA
ncbi:hypothetical protein ACFSTC_43475 [Nonomuraea ferruginea]